MLSNSKTNRKHILVTGIQRSGTTFTSRILAQSNELLYLPEPFNPDYGIVGVKDHYSYINSNEGLDITVQLLKDFFTFRSKYKKNYSRDNFLKKTIKSIFGPKAQVRYTINNLFRKNNSRFLIKDPDAALLSEYMFLNHHCQILILVRHPGAVLASYKRLGWGFDFDSFLTKKRLMKDYLSEFESLYKKPNKSLVEQVGLLWTSIYKVLRTYSVRHKNWLTILHEDLCLNPLAIFNDVFRWAEIPLTNNIKQKIVMQTNERNPIKARENKLHDFSRDSLNLASYWKEVVLPEERQILRGITEPISSFYYPETSWN